jgi:hypothetical protein
MSKDFDIHEWHLYQANLNLLTEEENEFDEPINVSGYWDEKELGVGDVITPDMWDEDKLKHFESNISNPSFFTKPHKITRIEKTYFDFIWFENGKYENFNFINNLLKPQYKVVLPSLNESDDEWDITTDSFDVTELGVGDKISPNMWEEDTGWSGSWAKILNIRYSSTDNNFVVIFIDLGDYRQYVWPVSALNDYLKPQYQIVPPLNESDEFNDEFDVSNKWNLSPEDEELLSHYNGDWEMTNEGLILKDDLDLRGTNIQSLGSLKSINGGLDLFDSEIKSLGNLQHVGDWLNLRGTKIESLGNLEIVEGNLHLRDTPLARKYTEEQIRQMVNVGGGIYGFDESIDESDDNFDDEINVSDMWNETNLWDGDIVTPDMWADDIDDYDGYVNYISGGKLKSFKDKNWTLKYLGDIYFELKFSNVASTVLDIVEIQKLLKPHYKLTPPLNESDDEWNVDVDTNWNVKTITTGDTFKVGNSVYILGEFSEGGKRVDIFKDDLSNPLNTTVKLLQSKLGDEYEIIPPVNESDDFDDEFDVSNDWNVTYLSVGDEFNIDMFKDEYLDWWDDMKYTEYTITKFYTWDWDGDYVIDFKGKDNVSYFMGVDGLNNYLKPEYRIVEP